MRWHGAREIERFLARLHAAAKSEDPEGLVTYVNYPSTEYLRLPFLDIACFNVYLEEERSLAAYIARLHNLSGDRPLILAEIGLDSRRNGEQAQARTLGWQVRRTFASGAAGALVFAWTDEWHINPYEPGADENGKSNGENGGPNGGFPVDDWDFGLTDRERRPKLALAAVAGAFSEVPFSTDTSWPRISVVVCTHNGARTIPDCLNGLLELEYPEFEVIVVSDGSTDTTAELVQQQGFTLIRGERMGLAAARNAGIEAATGEIVAFIDDDARPDPQWLTYLADSFRRGSWAGVGGPNLAPQGDGLVAESVANAPGGPIHVLVSDEEAEHIPGCNMAFRRTALEAIGGFDPIFGSAGDDVDLCWRLQDRDLRIGFNPAAVVWHRRRDSVSGYWRQQRGYGEAESLLQRKWPERYNGAGHLTWGGRVYHPIAESPWVRRRRIRYGKWGSALFQSVYDRKAGLLAALPAMPEWYLAILGLALLAALGAMWPPLLLASAMFGFAVLATVSHASLAAARVVLPATHRSYVERLQIRATVALLNLLQPAARLWGRLRGGLAPWWMHRGATLRVPRQRRVALWSESWRSPDEWIRDLEAALKKAGGSVIHGGSFDRWDLEVQWGAFGSARLLTAIEEYPEGKQFVRWRFWPRLWLFAVLASVACAALAVGAAGDNALIAAVVLAVIAIALLARMLHDTAAATGSIVSGLDAMRRSARETDTVATQPITQGTMDTDVGEPSLR